MAVYQYCAEAWDGAKSGYVKFSTVPDLSEGAAIGELVAIRGVFCNPLGPAYGLKVDLGMTADGLWTEGDSAPLMKVSKTAAKGRETAFVGYVRVPKKLESLGGEGRQIRPYLRFELAASADFSSTIVMALGEECRLSVLKRRLPPEIRGFRLSDRAGHRDKYGGFVFMESEVTAELDAHPDPLAPNVEIRSRKLDFGAFQGELGETFTEIGRVGELGDVPYTLTVTDSKGLSAAVKGSVKVFDYQCPGIEDLTAERYSAQVADDGSVTYIPDDAGEHVWFTFLLGVAALPGGNPWTLTAAWGNARRVVRQGADGTVIRFHRERSLVEAVISPAERVEFSLELTDDLHTVTMCTAVEKAGAYMNVEKWGVSVGMRSTGAVQEPLFESAYPARFYAGLSGHGGYRMDAAMQVEPVDVIHSGFSAYNAQLVPAVIRVGPMVFLEGILRNRDAMTMELSETTVAQLPPWAAPRLPVSVLQQGTNRKIWWLRIYPDGRVAFSRNRAEDAYSKVTAGSQFPLSACWLAGDAFLGAKP